MIVDEPVPARLRLLARARRLARRVLLALLVVASGLSWIGAAVVVLASGQIDGGQGGLLVQILAAHLVALGLLAVAAVVLARRSTRFIEAVFGQQDRITRAVVHEVRAPLGRLLAAVDEGRSGALAPEDALDEAAAEGEAISQFIGDLTEAARVFSGASPVQTAVTSLGALVTTPPRPDVVKGASIKPEPSAGVVLGSPGLLRLALGNLIRNAAEHGYQGGHGVIHVRSDRRGIAVLDDGPGVEPARLASLTGERPTGLPNTSVGFGLALANWVAELHGGQLALANRPAGGFEARLVLPVLDGPPPIDPTRGPTMEEDVT